ncbi:MAG: hypothetical protein DI556_01095 [Rhodovulum sulfidophilum]|uniref:Right handed beta helix domain-containing protein n=1 Tax=Rhodovulum sulfidophilum TaxID=35806 RepID=A0A2W5NFJ2_RHOSU|nr:MAG: hypothetical protein DI556_01095 [Rhodovulum sulfidophilum]
MSILSASNQTQLLNALKLAKAGDTIQLDPGRYGTLSLDGMKSATKYLKYTGEVKITSASASNKAVIDGLTLRGVSNLTFDKIEFDYATATTSNGIPFFLNNSTNVTFRGSTFGGEYGATGYGLGTGLKVSQGSNILLENSTLTGFRNGIEAFATEGLMIRGNQLRDIAYDGITTSNVQGLTIRSNTIAMRSDPAGDKHRDGIQIWNQHERAPSSNILIEKNTITATDTTTHGIYMGNADAKNTGSLSEFYTNVSILGNTVMTGQKLGIAIGQTNGLVISGNTIIQHSALNDNPKVVTIPVIHVEKDALNVQITNNTMNGAHIASDNNWQPVAGAGTAWTVSNNKIVALSWDPGQVSTDPWANVQGNGQADEFRFKGTSVTAERTDLVGDLLFSEGDTIVLINYEANSFKGVWKGNQLDVNATGTYVKMDSITDLQELVATSPKLSATVIGDTLTLHVSQTAGTHHIVLDGLGYLYQSTYDATLF